jgi:hypothetical protein
MVLVLAVALATLVGSYYYLAPHWPAAEAPDTMETLIAISIVVVSMGAAAATRWGASGGTPASLARRRLGLALGFLLGVAAIGLLRALDAYHETSYTRRIDAEGSFFYFLLLFQTLVTLLYLVLVAVAQLWAWRARSDPRGLAPAANATLVGYFLVLSWSVVYLTLYLSPRLLSAV